MKALKTMQFSEMKIGEESIKFEERQLRLYTDLAEKYPENEMYKRTQLELARQLEDDKELLATSGTKP